MTIRMIRLITSVILLVAGAWIFTLPSGTINLSSDGLSEMKDHDLRSEAETLWKNGQQDSAILLLDYIVEQNMADKESAITLKQKYTYELEQAQTPFGHLKAFGLGFATGNANGWDSLSGSALADFFVYGDVRDLTNEFIFKDEKDPFVILMSGLGVLTHVFPPAEPAVSLVKTLKKTETLGKSLEKQLVKVVTSINKSESTAMKISKAKDGLLPFYDLSKQSKTWGEYSTLIKYAESIDQVKVLSGISALRAGNARKLSGILTMAGGGSGTGARAVMDLVMQRGQKGMDIFYAAMRKGPLGLKFVAEHPQLVLGAAKNLEKTSGWLRREWVDYSNKSARKAMLLKFAALALISIILFYIIVPKTLCRVFLHAVFNTSSKPFGGLNLIDRQLGVVHFVFAALASGFVVLLSSAPLANLNLQAATERLSMASPGSLDKSHSLSVIGAVVVISVHVLTVRIVRNKVVAIAESSGSVETKMKHLENIEVFFDLPLYLGLLGTIASFVLINYNLGASRMAAYLSTCTGIIGAIVIRIRYVVPLKSNLLKHTDLSSK